MKKAPGSEWDSPELTTASSLSPSASALRTLAKTLGKVFFLFLLFQSEISRGQESVPLGIVVF